MQSIFLFVRELLKILDAAFSDTRKEPRAGSWKIGPSLFHGHAYIYGLDDQLADALN
jgi:hypothetical protein